MKNSLSKRSICLILIIPLVLGIGCPPVFSYDNADADVNALNQNNTDKVIDSAYSVPTSDQRQINAQNKIDIDNLIESNDYGIEPDGEIEQMVPVALANSHVISDPAGSVNSFVTTIAAAVLDTNFDGVIDSRDDDFDILREVYIREHDSDSIYFTCKNSGPSNYNMSPGHLSNSSKELLGMILIMAARTFGPDGGSMYLGAGMNIALINKNDATTTAVISGDGWNIEVIHVDIHLNVTGDTVSDLKWAFTDIENTSPPDEPFQPVKPETVGDIKSNFKVIENNNPGRHKLDEYKYGDFIEKKSTSGYNPKYSSSTNFGQPKDQPKGQDSYGSSLKKVVSEKKSVSRRQVKAAGQSAQGTRPDRGQDPDISDDRELLGTKGIDNDSELLIGSKWLEKKAALSDLFERILTEEPGAVYIKEKDGISAVILIAAAKDKKQDVYKGDKKVSN